MHNCWKPQTNPTHFEDKCDPLSEIGLGTMMSFCLFDLSNKDRQTHRSETIGSQLQIFQMESALRTFFNSFKVARCRRDCHSLSHML